MSSSCLSLKSEIKTRFKSDNCPEQHVIALSGQKWIITDAGAYLTLGGNEINNISVKCSKTLIRIFIFSFNNTVTIIVKFHNMKMTILFLFINTFVLRSD